jgi:hypothetical protein
MYMFVYSRGGPQTAPAPRPSLIYCASRVRNSLNVNRSKIYFEKLLENDTHISCSICFLCNLVVCDINGGKEDVMHILTNFCNQQSPRSLDHIQNLHYPRFFIICESHFLHYRG